MICSWLSTKCRIPQGILSVQRWLMYSGINYFTMKEASIWILAWFSSITSSISGWAISLPWLLRELSDIGGHNPCAFSEWCLNSRAYWGLFRIIIQTGMRFGSEMHYKSQDLITSDGQCGVWKSTIPIIL